jgi:periplasmic divalent cation tolerance protein
MKSAKSIFLVMVTAPSLKVGRKLAHLAVKSRLAACVNLLPKLESHYWWQGKVESSSEVLLLIKTTKAKLPTLEKLILAEHPYDTPEFIAIPLNSSNERYLAWIADSLSARNDKAAGG